MPYASPTVRPAPDVVAERFGSETVVLDPEADRYVRLNGTGSRLWAAIEIDSEASVEELVAVLVGEWDVSPERARADVDAFVAVLEAKGLVELTRR